MRILLVEPDLFDNGAIRVSLDRARYWQQAGHDITLFVVHRHAAPTDALVPPGLTVRYATTRPRRLRWTLLIAVLRLIVRARRADVVVAGREIGDGLLCAAVAARCARRPMAVTVQSRVDLALTAYISPRLHRPTRWALASADRAVCVAAGLVPILQQMGVPEGRTRVVTNGIDVPGVRRAAAHEPETALDPNRRRVTGSGRLNPQKGFDILVRAHARALADGAPDHDLVILGAGPDQDDLVDLAQELGVTDSVQFVGFVSNPHAVVARSDLFVLSSRWEGYPLALVEALSIGVPVVAADCVSGPSEILEAGKYGALVPADDPDALAGALVRHLSDLEELRVKARAAQALAEDRYDPAGAARRHLDVLQDLVT